MLRDTCVFTFDVQMFVANHIWPPRLGDSSSVLIGAGGLQQSDWPRARVGCWRAREGRSIAGV